MVTFDFETYNNIKIDNYNLDNILDKFKTENIMSGWYDLNTNINNIIEISSIIKERADVLIVIGIGGSYLGAQAVIEALSPYFNRNKPEIIYLGTNLSSDYMYDLVNYLKDKNVYVNAISKSGKT